LPLDTRERIKDLCAELSSSSDPDRVKDISSQLQLAIHEHIEDLRARLLDVPAATPFQQLRFDGLRGPAQRTPDLTADRENTRQSDSQLDVYCGDTAPGTTGPGRNPSAT